jgi:hypothetical protein
LKTALAPGFPALPFISHNDCKNQGNRKEHGKEWNVLMIVQALPEVAAYLLH